MKYWKNKKGECGTMNDNGSVPESIEITKEEYNTYVSNIPIQAIVVPIIEYENVDTGEKIRLKKIKS